MDYCCLSRVLHVGNGYILLGVFRNQKSNKCQQESKSNRFRNEDYFILRGNAKKKFIDLYGASALAILPPFYDVKLEINLRHLISVVLPVQLSS